MSKNRQDYHHGDLKRALLKAALEILGQEGYQALSLRRVAKGGGVSSAALYRHYADLEELYAELAREGFVFLKEDLTRTRERFAKNPLLQFRNSAITYVEFALQRADLFQIMYGPIIADHSMHPGLMAAEEEAFAVLHAIIRDCQKAKFVGDGDLGEKATAAWVMVHGMANLLLGNQVMLRNFGRRRARDMTKHMIEHLYMGLR